MSGEMKKPWTRLSSRIAYENHWIKLQEDKVLRPDGKEGLYAFIHKAPGNFIIPVDKDGDIYFIREYKYPIDEELIQLPGGVVEGDDILGQAKKELLEETGLRADKWVNLGILYVGPGHEDIIVHIWLACELSFDEVGLNHQEGDEAISELFHVSPMIISDMISNDEITDAVTLAALLKYFHSK
jgi:ADP-ribose pyrophosphatase